MTGHTVNRAVNLTGYFAGSGVPWVLWGGGLVDSRCGCWLVSSLGLDECEHAKRGVASLTVVQDLEVLEDRVGWFGSCLPALPVEQFDLHS